MRTRSCAATIMMMAVSVACGAQIKRDGPDARPKPKNLFEVKAGMRFQEDVVVGLSAEYKLTKIWEAQNLAQWSAQKSSEEGEIDVKDGVVIGAGIFLPSGSGDAASYINELVKAFYLKTRPDPDDMGTGIRSGDAHIEILTNPVVPGLQRIWFTFADGSGYTIFVFKSEKSDKPLVQLEKYWH
jgi:hypothetical protein